MASKHTFQAPRGTRDFYPEDMAIRRYIESVWREVSINHGFEEIEGPMFEHLDLYTVKSGEGIVNELFSFSRAGGDTQYALRPEFTPTLARMYAAKARELPKPTKWFVIPNHFRAERPQRGRLREFMQWNVDFIGGPPSPPEGEQMFVHAADAEVISVAVRLLEQLGLTPKQVRIKFGHRLSVRKRLLQNNVPESMHDRVFQLLDDRLKLPIEEYRKRAEAMNLPKEIIRLYDPEERLIIRLDADAKSLPVNDEEKENIDKWLNNPGSLPYELNRLGLTEWCEFDSMIIRGLAYYTDLVFEIHEATGKERAIAGGGRYDGLIAMFGGPKTPAVGFAMGDVVLRLVLEDNNLLGPDRVSMPKPDVFVISLGDDAADSTLKKIVSDLRGDNHHVRHTYKATRKLKKLLGEAEGLGSRLVVILDEKLAQGEVTIKDMEGGAQEQVRLDDLRREIDDRLK